LFLPFRWRPSMRPSASSTASAGPSRRKLVI
jgi:hypothetical protein